jgi:hypothetical protein
MSQLHSRIMHESEALAIHPVPDFHMVALCLPGERDDASIDSGQDVAGCGS